MKRLLLLFIGVVMPLFCLAQSSSYNPQNPPNPVFPEPDTTTYYTVECLSIPSGAGSFSVPPGKTQFKEGEKITVYASDTYSRYFHEWKNIYGEVLSTSRSYSFTMPAENVKLYATYTYEPNSPANPEFIGSYQLTLETQPKVAGSFNRSNGKITEGTTVSLYAYSNDGFTFKYWADEKGNAIGTSQSLSYLMPSAATKLTAVYEYGPSNPGNPSVNWWDALTGEAIIDNFAPGYLNSTTQNKVGSSNYSKVVRYTVDGQMTSNDFQIANTFKNVTYLDLSRVGGVSYVPSYIWENNTSLQEIELPACIDEIRREAFSNCTSLLRFNIYSPVPPVLGYNVFAGVSKEMVVYVPEESVELYDNAEGWKEFTISPLRSKVCSLQLNLPKECADGRYKNMTLELVNIKTGQKFRYVITDRLNYTFGTLVKNSYFRARLKNLAGDVLGEIDQIVIDDVNVNLTFSDLKVPQTVTMNVVDEDGNSLDDMVDISWSSAKGDNRQSGKSYPLQLSGNDIQYDITIPKDFYFTYVKPEHGTYTVQESGNNLTVTLKKLPKYAVEGRVMSSLTGQYITGATVTASQTIDGVTKTFNAKSNFQGQFMIKVAGIPTDITFSADNCVNSIVSLNQEMIDGATDSRIYAGMVPVKPIDGVVVKVGFTYQESVAAEEEKTIQNFYSNYANISYALYNKTQDKPITDFSAQYPQIIILSGAVSGDEIEMTCTDNGNQCETVTVTGKVNENNRLNFTVPLVQKAGFEARFLVTDNTAVTGILYKADGTMYESRDYASGNWKIYNLPEGDYQFITIGKSEFFNSIYSLESLTESGLTEGVDYLSHKFSAKAGQISQVRHVVVPVFNESQFYYTGENTSFSVNRGNIIQGNYLTLSGRLDFADEFRNSVSDIEMVIRIPEGTSLVEGSVILGKDLSSYEYRDNQIVVPFGDNYTERVKLCIVPTERGNYTANAFVRFVLDGQTILQPIGSAAYTVTDMTVWAPDLISTPEFVIDGNAAAQSLITVYDGDRVLGTTKALADGYWSLEASLHNPANLSMHQIYAQVTTPSGITSETERRTVEYNERSIQAKSIKMSFYNSFITVNRTVWVEFDLQHYTTTQKSYMFQPGTDFVFTADLTNNDPSVVHSCIIRVFTNNHEWIEVPAKYIPNLDRWVGVRSFSNQSMPIGVRAVVDADISTGIDLDELAEEEEEIDEHAQEIVEILDSLKQMPDVLNDPDAPIYPEDDEEDDDQDGDQDDDDEELPTDEDGWDEDNWDEDEWGDQYDQYPWEEFNPNNFILEDIDNLFDENGNQMNMEFTDWDDNSYEYFQEPASRADLSAYDQDTIVLSTTDDDINMTMFIAEDKSFVVTQTVDVITQNGDTIQVPVDEAMLWGIGLLDNENNGPRSVRAARKPIVIDATVTTILKERISDLEKSIYYVNRYIRKTGDPLRANIAALTIQIENAQADGDLETVSQLTAKRYKMAVALEEVNGYISIIRKLNMLIKFAHYGIKDINDWQELIDRILPCNGIDDPQARALSWICTSVKNRHAQRYIMACEVAKIAAALSVAMDEDQGVPTLSLMSAQISDHMLTYAIDMYLSNKAESRNHMRWAKRDKNEFECNYDVVEELEDKWDFSLPYPLVEPIIDPSGFVYEAVQSNRLPDVKATAYYKHTYEDMYGDLQQEIVLWDAAQYSQENPLYTDEDGMYQWDVPQGLWQVKFEKEGYETAYSEWLPVPPPQMDVNIGLKQNVQPLVTSARAFNEGDVEVVFSKYMKPETLNGQNMYLKGIKDTLQTLIDSIAFSYPDLESVSDTSSVKFASRVLMQTAGLDEYDEVYVLVAAGVESYAGFNMTEPYQQKLDIERKIKSISVDSIMNIGFQANQKMIIGALPTEAAAGKKVIVSSAQAMVASLGADSSESVELVLDADGQAELTVNGDLFGSTALKFQIVGEDIKATSMIKVVDPAMLEPVKAPVASRINGTSVYRGQTVSLSCETEGAEIFYTLDGTCPCEHGILYTGPIAITDDMTLRIMATGINGDDSEIREYHYSIRQSTVSIDLAQGWNWASHDVARGIAVDSISNSAIDNVVLKSGASMAHAVDGMHIKASEPATITFTGDQINPSQNALKFNTGWNWMGYPVDQNLALTDALSYLEPSEGDIIATLGEGFSVFTDGQWQGHIQALHKGTGYMYKSVEPKEFIYNTVASMNADALFGHELPEQMPWTNDRHQFENMMCAVVEVFDEDTVIAQGYIGAFVGDECRGVAKVENGKAFLAIYGEKDETVYFKTSVFDISINETVKFNADILGTVQKPYSLHLSMGSGVEVVNMDNDGRRFDLHGIEIQTPVPGQVIIEQGRKVLK